MALNPDMSKEEQKYFIEKAIDIDNKCNKLVRTRMIIKSAEKGGLMLFAIGVVKIIVDTFRKSL